jgi:SOUL heme-binding protein
MKISKSKGALIGGGAVVLAGLAAKLVFDRTPEPPFQVERTLSDLEIRAYAPMVIAETTTSGELRDALNEGFRRLAGYIFGGNRKREKIEMTAPVAQRGEKIEMTAPVGARSSDGGRHRITFVMPAGRTLSSLPEPNDARVILREVPARRVAALRFTGWVTESLAAEKKREALSLLEQANLKPAGEPELAQYNPPWSIPFLRRNEILIDLAE